MTKEMKKIIKYIEHGIDDRIILLEMIKDTKDDEFIYRCEELILIQVPNELADLKQKFERVANKINALDECIKSGADIKTIENIASKHYATLKKIEAEIVKMWGVKGEN